MRIAVVQMRSTDEVWLNLANFQSFCQMAEEQGCELVCFPENLFYRGSNFDQIPLEERPLLIRDKNSNLLKTNEFSRALLEILQGTKMAVSLGSVREKSLDETLEKPMNSHWVVHGSEPIVSYSKLHLFHFGKAYRESLEFTRGQSPVSTSIGSFKFGLSICYDLRFPELYRFLTLYLGAEVLLIPAAFTRETGRAHWKALLRARAIENQAYVIASAQWGHHLGKQGERLYCYGHSMVIDPWGAVLAEASESSDDLLIVDLNLEDLKRVREALPALKHGIFKLSYELSAL